MKYVCEVCGESMPNDPRPGDWHIHNGNTYYGQPTPDSHNRCPGTLAASDTRLNVRGDHTDNTAESCALFR